MKRLTHVLPLFVIGVLLFVSVAVAQSTPDQGDLSQDGVDPNAVDPGATDPTSTPDPSTLDPSTVDPSAVDPSTLTADPNAPSQTVNNVVDFRLVTVDIEPWGFWRAHMPVEPGTTVRWINLDNQPHTVTADDGSFDSGVLKPGESFDFRFDALGRWHYYDANSTMTGSIIVGEPTPAAAEPTPPADSTAAQPTDGTTTQPTDNAATPPTDGTTAM